MTLLLDDRRRAMLREMGVPLPDPLPRWVQARPGPLGEAVPAVPARLELPAPRARIPLVQPGVEAPVASGDNASLDQLDWQAWTAAVARRAAALGRRPVPGAGAHPCDWLFVGDAPGEAEEQQGQPVAGDAATLVQNMLAALGLPRRNGAYVTNLLKCRPSPPPVSPAEEAAQWEPFLRREVQLVQPKVIVAMGRLAVQAMLRPQEAVGRLRGRLHAYQGVPVVVTYAPSALLRTPADKANAWADLCLARSAWQNLT